MSPVRVKLGDFGISKRILPQDTTTFHTQVSTQIYGAPEVLGSDSDSETSVYTNSVDIWSLGCVIYELLVGTHLFTSGEQVSRYYYRSLPFPEDKLKGLSPPTDDAGISLLKSMLAIQPGDRPTAEDALGNAWLVGLKSGEDSGDESGDESSWGRKREGELTALDEQKRRNVQRNPIAQDNLKYASRDVASGRNARLQLDSDFATPKPATDTTTMTPPEVTSAEGSRIWKGPMKSEFTTDALQLPGHSFNEPRDAMERMDSRYSTNTPPKLYPKYQIQPTYKTCC